MINILVTGANGLLGQKLTQLLEQDPEINVIATARKPLTYPFNKGKFIRMDITDEHEVSKVIKEVRPDIIINTAAMTQVDQCETEREACWLNNVTAVDHLIKAAEKTGAHLIHLSTDFIFDGSYGPLKEDATPNPLSYYGKSKLAAEVAVQKSAAPWTIIRTVLVYGITRDMSRSNIVLWVKKSLEEGKTITLVTDQWRTPTLAEDLAIGCLLAARKKLGGIYHISGDEMMTPFDIAKRTAAFFKLDKNLIQPTDSTKFRQPAQRPLKTGFIIEKARRELGYAPRSFEQGLAVIKETLSNM